jgi:hypothetical protein
LGGAFLRGFKIIWNEAIMVLFFVLSCHLAGGAEEIMMNLSQDHHWLALRSEPSISLILVQV